MSPKKHYRTLEPRPGPTRAQNRLRRLSGHVLEYWPFYLLPAIIAFTAVGRLTGIIPAG